MISLTKSLVDNHAKDTGDGLTIPVKGGRFKILSDYSIVDTQFDITYEYDRSVPFTEGAVQIPGLNDSPIKVAYFYALAVKPLLGLTDAQKLANTGMLPLYKEGALLKNELSHSDFIWTSPVGGELGTHGFSSIAGFGKYYADLATGDIKHVSDDTPVLTGTGRQGVIVLIDDGGSYVEVQKAHIILLANGALNDLSNLEPDVYYIDDNVDNVIPANISLEPNIVLNASVEVADTDNDFIVGNE